MFLASSQMTSETLRMRIAQIEQNNGHTLIAQQIRNASIPSVIDARPASAAAMSRSLPSAAAPAAAPVLDPSDHSVPRAAAVGEGEGTELDLTAAELPRQDVRIASHGIAERSSEPVASSTPPAALSLPIESPGVEPTTGPSAAISRRSAPLAPVLPSAPLAVSDPRAETLFELLAWEAANVPAAWLRVGPAHADLPPAAPLDEELPVGDRVTSEPSASNAEESTPLKLESANGLEAEIVDELFGCDDDLLESPELIERWPG
jgi:hypothetical protein